MTTQSPDPRIAELRKRIIRDSVGNPGELQDTQLLEDAIALATTLASERDSDRADYDEARKRLWEQAKRLDADLSSERARREELERENASLHNRIGRAEVVLDLVHEIRDGGGTLEPQLRTEFDKWVSEESRRVTEAFVNLRAGNAPPPSTAAVVASSVTGEGATDPGPFIDFPAIARDLGLMPPEAAEEPSDGKLSTLWVKAAAAAEVEGLDLDERDMKANRALFNAGREFERKRRR